MARIYVKDMIKGQGIWGVKIGNRWARFKDWDKLSKKPKYAKWKLRETPYAVTQNKKEAENWAKKLKKVI